jgi:amino-acid N-acetyltransferase
LAVHSHYQRDGVGRDLVKRCVDRARELNIMEVLAISSSEEFLSSCGFDYALPDQKKALFYQLRPRHPD